MKLLLNPQNYEKPFVGRSEEYAALRDVLEGSGGGTVLVSGDRGSGKTRLIQETIKSIKTARLPFFEKVIHVEIPLITTDKIDNKDILRGLLLRSVIHALGSEDKANYWKRFRSPFYRHHLKELVKRTEYSKITKSMGANGGLSGHGASTSLERTWQGIVDLSDIKLELYLTDFLRKYSKKYKMVVVFDELDKYEETNGLDPAKYIESLKNFFTANNVTFIFVSTEKFFGQILDSIASVDSKERTMFTKRILINHISPTEFSRLIDSYFDDEPKHTDKEYEILKLSIMWQTNLYPFDLISALDELKNSSGTEPYIETTLARKSLGEEVWGDRAYLLKFINYVYKETSKAKDDYFNRYLYKALKEMSVAINNPVGIELNPLRPIASLFSSSDFGLNEDKSLTDFVEQGKLPPIEYMNDGWKKGVIGLNVPDYNAINDALLLFIWILDRLNFIDIDNSGKESNSQVVLSVKTNSLLDLKGDAQITNVINKLGTRELSAKALIRQLNNIARNYESGTLDGKVKSTGFEFYKRAKDDINKDDINFLSTLRYRLKPIIKSLVSELFEIEKAYEINFISRLDGFVKASSLKEKINQSGIATDTNGGRFIDYSVNNKLKFNIYINLEKERQQQLIQAATNQYIYTVVNNGDDEYVKSPRFRKFNLNLTWSNINKVLDDVVNAMNKDIEAYDKSEKSPDDKVVT